jgi:hypothetical protein
MLDADHNPSENELRWLGLSLGGMLTVLGFIVARVAHYPAARWIGAAGSVALVASYYLLPATRRPIVAAWRRVQRPIAFIGWQAAMLVVFYLIVTPIGLIMRRLGRDALGLGFDSARPSYWQARPVAPEVERYFRQF